MIYIFNTPSTYGVLLMANPSSSYSSLPSSSDSSVLAGLLAGEGFDLVVVFFADKK